MARKPAKQKKPPAKPYKYEQPDLAPMANKWPFGHWLSPPQPIKPLPQAAVKQINDWLLAWNSSTITAKCKKAIDKTHKQQERKRQRQQRGDQATDN